jgi:hypothetical protein
MWEALPEANRYNSVWLCNSTTAGIIDQLAVGGQWPELQYLRAGPSGWTGATLKGRPMVWSEFCPGAGTPGDLILWDPTQYLFTYLPMTTDNPSPLAWDIGLDYIGINDVKIDPLGRVMFALPEGAFESRISGHTFFTTDVLVAAFKVRMDFQSIWAGPIVAAQTTKAGATIKQGPCVIAA